MTTAQGQVRTGRRHPYLTIPLRVGRRLQRGYARRMQRATSGQRRGRASVRVVAALTVLGLVVVTAPFIAAPIVAILHWLLDLL